MIKNTTLILMLIFGFGSMVQAAVSSEGVALYKHSEDGSKITQGFVDPKTSMNHHPDSIPKEPINKVTGEQGLNLNNRIKDSTQLDDAECNSTDWCQ